jgi:para-aminobenzoate synthetase/4-amino-4-deoxychorismate lyase
MIRLDPSRPFVLFDDARHGDASPARLYADPVEIVATSDPAEIPALLDRLRDGDWAGFLCYEAGHALEPRLGEPRQPGLPLLWFGRFEGYQSIARTDVEALLPSPESGWLGRPMPDISADDYATALMRVKGLIEAGDIYQANLTLRAQVKTAGHPLALYAGMRERARAGYGGVVWTGQDWLLSLSPELFFALHDGHITTKPMKGTTRRGRDAASDDAAKVELRADPKQRAENLMIVDLLRNDLSRVAVAGSVKVPQLFTVETYPTIHTMISVVTGEVQSGLGAAEVLKAIFPCGSVTGAPKIRAMEVIDMVEPTPRGIYTGSIGRVDASGDSAFNVAIRTLHIRDGESVARLGLGGGIVADSQLAAEWDECLAKGRFIADPRRFDLIETMRFDPHQGILLLERHLSRMKESARALDFAFDRHAARNELQAATFRLEAEARIRLLLSRSGRIAIETGACPPPVAGPVSVAIAPLSMSRHDFRLRHKTSERAFYDAARRSCGAFEVLFTDPDGLLTEGSFTSIFVEQDGILLTPPLTRGLLPGILRAEFLDSGRAVERDLRPGDLAGGFFIGNALRGLIPAVLD